MRYFAGTYDVAVIGAGHAGIEAALVAARLGLRTVLFTINLDAVGNMPCNPAIGGTGKGHLVRELDALGGEMGKAADACCIQYRMLNRGKGPAVHSLRAQADRRRYQEHMKQLLEREPRLELKQATVTELLTENGALSGVVTQLGAEYRVKACVVAAGTYLDSRVIIGDCSIASGDMPYRSANDIFTGWDKVSTNVQSDLNVNALFEAASVPAVKATDYDYLYSDDSSDNSGYSLGELFGIINSGQASTWFELGDKIKILTPTTAFTDTSIVLSLIGFNHFRLADGTAMAKTVWHMIGAMSAPYKHHTTNVNTGGWAQSDIRTYLNETVLKNLPIHWQALIKTVQVKSSIGGLSAEISTSQDKLFLLSTAEVTTAEAAAVPYKNEIDADADNITFAVFTDNNSRIRKTFNAEGSAVYWWLRSPDPSSATYFRYVGNNGNVGANYASIAYSLAWGFCI